MDCACCSLQRTVPVHAGHGIADGSAGDKEGGDGVVRAEAPSRGDDSALQGVEPGHNTHRQCAQAVLPQALPNQQHQLLRTRHRGAHLELCQRRDGPSSQRTVR